MNPATYSAERMRIRKLSPLWIMTVSAVVTLAFGDASESRGQGAAATREATTEKTTAMTIEIKAGGKGFLATLEDNATAKAFVVQLPISAEMTELNGNEKHFRLASDLPTKDSDPGTIRAGDLMIYGRNTLVLFYKSFSTSYRYTRLGRVNDPAGLAAALGTGNVKVAYELQQKPKGK